MTACRHAATRNYLLGCDPEETERVRQRIVEKVERLRQVNIAISTVTERMLWRGPAR